MYRYVQNMYRIWQKCILKIKASSEWVCIYPAQYGVNKSWSQFFPPENFLPVDAGSEYALCGFWMDCNGCNFIKKFSALPLKIFIASQCLNATQLNWADYNMEHWPLFSKNCDRDQIFLKHILYQWWLQILFGVTRFEIRLSRARPIGLIERQKAWWGSQTSYNNWTIVHGLFCCMCFIFVFICLFVLFHLDISVTCRWCWWS